VSGRHARGFRDELSSGFRSSEWRYDAQALAPDVTATVDDITLSRSPKALAVISASTRIRSCDRPPDCASPPVDLCPLCGTMALADGPEKAGGAPITALGPS